MVTNGYGRPVGLEGVVGSSEHDSNIISRILRGVKVGVVTNEHGELHLNIIKVVEN